LSHDLCPFGPNEACRHAISVFYAKYHEQLNMVGVIVNFLREQTCEGPSEMLHMFVQHCPWSPYGMVDHVDARNFLSLFHMLLVPTHHRSVNWYYLVQVYLIKLVSNMGTGFQLCQPQNTFQFMPHGNCLAEAK
jgi:hypothetical protein